MSFRTSVVVALQALRRNRLRTALTMIGMTIGVATVLAMIALGTGAQAAIEQQVRAAGMNLIIVKAGNYKMKSDYDGGGVVDHQAALGEIQPTLRRQRAVWISSQPPRVQLVMHPEDDPMEKHDHPLASQRLGDLEAGLGSAATLTAADAEAIRQLDGVQFVSEGIHENAHVVAGPKRWFTRLHGGDVQLPLIRRAWRFSAGRFFTQREQSRAAPVMVVGRIVEQKLFGERSAVGQLVKLWNQAFEIVGVLTTSNWMVAPAVGDDQFDAVYVPFTTVHKLLNLTKLNDITITAASTGDVSRVAAEVTRLLRSRHRIRFKDPDDFTVTTQARSALAQGGLRPDVAKAVVGNVTGLEKVTLEQLARTLDRASRTMTALLASVAAVSLIVGGIGIMNIMLLSVTERTREIGIRRAVGARAVDVMRQFLVEAVVLGGLGGTVGIVFGLAASLMMSRVMQWSANISLWSIAISLAVAPAVGVLFGYYPARQASLVAPIESLRYE
jgi:ABC-type antimicrobial peptide transport system permease subunit